MMFKVTNTFGYNSMFKMFLHKILGIFNVQIQSEHERGANSCILCVILKLKTRLIFISGVIHSVGQN